MDSSEEAGINTARCQLDRK